MVVLDVASSLVMVLLAVETAVGAPVILAIAAATLTSSRDRSRAGSGSDDTSSTRQPGRLRTAVETTHVRVRVGNRTHALTSPRRTAAD